MPTVPNIFTSTPIEGFILALFWRAQVALAAMMEATAIFRLALFIALAWAIVLGFLRMVSHKHHAAQHFFHMCYRVGLVYVALAFTTQAGSANFASLSTSQKQWGAMARVQSNPQLGPALTQPSDALYWYLVLFKGMNQLATAMQTSIASAFSVPPEAMNSRFVARQLSRMSVMSLGPATAQAFDALNESCLDTSFQTSVAGDLTNMKDMYDLTTHPECQDYWTQFETSLYADGDALAANMGTNLLSSTASGLASMFPSVGGNWVQTVKNYAMSNAIHTYAARKAGFEGRGTFSITGLSVGDTVHNTAATMSGTGDYNAQYIGSEGVLGAGLTDFMQTFGFDARGWGMKIQAATMFDNISSLIPTLRAFIQGALALMFVFAAYSVGFGTWKFMIAWLYAQGMVCLYSPLAALGFQVASYFQQANKSAAAWDSFGASPLLAGGAKMMQTEMYRIQTTYLIFEIGIFGIFLVGSVAAFGPAMKMSGSAGAAMVGAATQRMVDLGEKMMNAQGRGAQSNVNVNVNNGVPPGAAGGGGPPRLPSNGNGGVIRALEGHPATSAPGVITPSDSSRQSKSNWPDAA